MKKVSFKKLVRGQTFRLQPSGTIYVRDVDRDSIHGYAYRSEEGSILRVSEEERKTLKVYV